VQALGLRGVHFTCGNTTPRHWEHPRRKGHEARINELEGRVDALLGDDSAERRIVKEIAQAHGGAHNGDADTIQHLVDGPVLNQNVRTRFLAGLLRFADELADDSQRISAFAIQNDAIPESASSSTNTRQVCSLSWLTQKGNLSACTMR